MIDKAELEADILVLIDKATTWSEKCAYNNVLNKIKEKALQRREAPHDDKTILQYRKHSKAF